MVKCFGENVTFMLLRDKISGCLRVDARNDVFELCVGANEYGDKLKISVISDRTAEPRLFDKVNDAIKFLRKNDVNRPDLVKIHSELMLGFNKFKRKKMGLKFGNVGIEEETEV